MKHSKEALNEMEFIDKLETKSDEEDVCVVCGTNSDILVGYNEKERLHKYECTNCGAIFVMDKETSERVLLKGEMRV